MSADVPNDGQREATELPEHLRAAADLRSAMIGLAYRIRAGQYSDDELLHINSLYTELADATALVDLWPEPPADQVSRTLLAACNAAASDVIGAITEFRGQSSELHPS